MIEATEVKREATEEDVMHIYTELAGALNALKKLFVSYINELKDQGVENIDRAYLSVKQNEVYISLGKVYLFHTETTETGQSGKWGE